MYTWHNKWLEYVCVYIHMYHELFVICVEFKREQSAIYLYTAGMKPDECLNRQKIYVTLLRKKISENSQQGYNNQWGTCI